jgi:ApbE superfamily uncharacterized protein (UPF0280 family)
MKQFASALIAGMLIWAGPAAACSGTDLIQKQKAYADAVKAAFARDPGGDAARQAQVQAVIGRYSDLKNRTNGSAIIDALCKENDELLAIYK